MYDLAIKGVRVLVASFRNGFLKGNPFWNAMPALMATAEYVTKSSMLFVPEQEI